MKKNYELTEMDKREIISKIDAFYKDEDSLNTLSGVMVGVFGVVGSIAGLIIGTFYDPLAFRGIFLALFSGVFGFIVAEVEKRKSFRKNVTKKISYHKFKQLEKSGEIAKWKQHYKENLNIQVANYLPEEKEQASTQTKVIIKEANSSNEKTSDFQK